MRGAALPFLLLLGGCFVDAIGEPDSSTGGGGTGTTGNSTATFATGEPTTTTTVSVSSTGVGGDAAGGGGGSQTVCGDGVAEAPEACEDGNMAAGDGCTSCMFDAAMCGDGVFQAGETCETGDPDCASCQLTTGTCFSAMPLPLGTTNLTLTAQALAPFPNDCNVQGTTTRAYRFETGPYPRGVIMSLSEGDPSQWPAVWASYGCGSEVLTSCDSSQFFAFLVTPILAPGTVTFFGVADESNVGGSLTLIARPYRGRWRGPALAQWNLGQGSWVYDGGWQELHDFDGSAETMSRATAPPTFVGGLAQVTVAVLYGKNAGSSARVIASTDGGATFAPVGADLPDADFNAGGSAERVLPLGGATSVIVGVELDHPGGGGGSVWFNRVAVLEQ